MRSIHKYSMLDWTDELKMPRGARVVHVALQHDRPTLWAEVDTDVELVPRGVAVVGTGLPIPGDGASHVGTFHDGGWVWHVYLQDDPQ